MENWKDIKNYEGYYQVSDLGNIRRIINGNYRPLKARDGKYYTVDLCKQGIRKSHSIHRLVAETFILNERINVKDEVNHIDGNKHNNVLSNLEWVSQRANLEHSIIKLKHFPYGKEPRAVEKIDSETNEIVETYDSIANAARSCGTINARTGITFVCQGLQKTAYGYKWRYVQND